MRFIVELFAGSTWVSGSLSLAYWKKLGNLDLVYFFIISEISFGGSDFHNVFANL